MNAPPRIIICTVEGDWIEWERDEPPKAGDCPFADCDCTPALYERATIIVIEASLLAEVERRDAMA